MTTTNNTRDADRKYMKYKMRRIKEAKESGNRAEVNRHAIDVIQYFSVDGTSERPIEDTLNKVMSMESDKRFKRLREGTGSRYE